jgi:hypothetical protein
MEGNDCTLNARLRVLPLQDVHLDSSMEAFAGPFGAILLLF